MIRKLEDYFMENDPEEGPVLNKRGMILALVYLIIAVLIVSYTS